MYKVKPHNWITVGSRNAVVCRVFDKTNSFVKVEVVYLDDKDQAIGEEVTWQNGKWEFTSPDGIYADNHSRFNDFVSQLRAGRGR